MLLLVAADSLLCLSSARTWAADTICTWSGLTPVVRIQAVCNQSSAQVKILPIVNASLQEQLRGKILEHVPPE